MRAEADGRTVLRDDFSTEVIMEFGALINRSRARFLELEAEIAEGSIYNDQKRSREVLREHSRLKKLLEDWTNLDRTRQQLEDNRELAKEDDVEMATLSREEIPGLEKRVAELETRVQLALLPPDPNEGRDVILEIRAGTGGNEAAIFAADLYRMYQRLAEIRGWRLEQIDMSSGDLGGVKEVVAQISGDDAFTMLRFESGVHRVQRVPVTETQGRIHTSTATVAALPEAQDVDLDLKPEDVRVEVCRAGGPGGQGVNTTDSTVQVMHIPTGTIVRIQDGRSQIKNREKAMSVLRSRLLEKKQREEAEQYAEHRRSLIGGGGREEKIRTYNYPQNRLTDHRIGLTMYNLDSIMEGNLEDVLDSLARHDLEERLSAGI